MSSAVITITFGFVGVGLRRLERPGPPVSPVAEPSARPAPSAAVPLSRLRRVISDSAATAVQLHDEGLPVARGRAERVDRRREVGGLRSSGDVDVPIGVDGDGATEVERRCRR